MKLMARLVWICLLALAAWGADADVARLAEAARVAWKVPGVAVAVVRDDKVLYLGGLGVREAGKPEPVTAHTAFHIASTTKAFTTTSLAMLADEGKLSFDDAVRKHVDYFRLSDAQADTLVTLRDLVSHRTGMPRHDVLWSRTKMGREDLIRRMAFAKPSAQFRSLYQYQNIMFTTAGEAVGKASGLGWDAFVQRRIFLPLGMKDSSTRYVETLTHNDLASPHIRGKAYPMRNYDSIGGAGSIASSVHDLSRWVRMQLNGGKFEGQQLVSERNLRETHEPQMVIHRTAGQKEMQPDFAQSSYAMGWFVNHYRGEMLTMHSGSLSGFRALVTMVPRLKLGIIILANENSTNLNEALTNTLLDEYLDLPKLRDWNAHMLAVVKRNDEKDAADRRERETSRKKDTRPSLPLAAYAGNFNEAAYGPVRISSNENALRLEWAGNTAALEHWHLDTWKIAAGEPMAGEYIQFEFSEQGVPVRLTLLGQTFSRQ